MLPTDTILRQVDLRLGEMRPNYCIVILIQAEDGEHRIVLHEGSVGLDGQCCFHTGRYAEPQELKHPSPSGMDAAFEEALRFRRSIGWVDAPAHLTVPFTRDSPTSDATAHVYFAPSIGVKPPTAAKHLASYVDIPAVALASETLAAAKNTSGQWPVLKSSAMLPCLIKIAETGCAQLTRKGRALSAWAITTLIVNSAGDTRDLYLALGLLKTCPENFSTAIGVPASALVL